MSDKNINAWCTICNQGYHICNTCREEKTFKPWRSVTDTIEHYKIYLAIHGYTLSKDKEKARNELKKCDLSGMDNFNPEIKDVIKKIMVEPKKTKNVSNKEFAQNEINE